MVAYADERRSSTTNNAEQAVDPARRPNTGQVVQQAMDKASDKAAQHSSRSQYTDSSLSVVTTARAASSYAQVVDAANQVIDTKLAELQTAVPLSPEEAAALRDQYRAAIALAAHGIAEDDQRKEEKRLAEEQAAAGVSGQTPTSVFKRTTPGAHEPLVSARKDLRPNESPPPETPIRSLGQGLVALANERESTPAGFNLGPYISPVNRQNEERALSA
jgi:hypothetical protein